MMSVKDTRGIPMSELVAKLCAEDLSQVRAVTLCRLEIEQQCSRLNDIQCELYRLERIFRAIAVDDIDADLARDVASTAATASELLADGMASQAIDFAFELRRRFDTSSAQGEEAEE